MTDCVSKYRIDMTDLLLVTPPFVRPDGPHPETAYQKGYLGRKGYAVEQADLSVELFAAVFTKDFLRKIFGIRTEYADENIRRIHALRDKYCSTVEAVMDFLRGENDTLPHLICTGEYLPQAGRFAAIENLGDLFGTLGTTDCAKYLCTLYLHDIGDFIRATVSGRFGIGRRNIPAAEAFETLENELISPPDPIEERMLELLETHLLAAEPTHVCFSVPLRECLLPALRCARYIRTHRPGIRIVLEGRYPSAALRNPADGNIFRYIDYLVLDDGELPLERILSGGNPPHTLTADGRYESGETVTHLERGCPDFSGLPLRAYPSLIETADPVRRLRSDGRWNRMRIAHGCYWARCTFCDTSLDRIRRYENVPAPRFVDWMEKVTAQTGSRGFLFTDEAAPPEQLQQISLEIIRRRLHVAWQARIRFEEHYTGDLCLLMAAAGCVAVSGGLEAVSKRLLERMDKGTTLERAVLAIRNLSDAGIMVHTDSMYGFPTQTLQETVDSLEVVRQLFRAELIQSARFRRYTMTVHSPSGIDPERYGVKRRKIRNAPFADYEIPFGENRGYDLRLTGEALDEALANYMRGDGIDRPVHKWFAGKVPRTAIDAALVADRLIEPDPARLYDEKARLVWIGLAERHAEGGLTLYGASGSKHLKFEPNETEFLTHILPMAADLSRHVAFGEVAEIYETYSGGGFVPFYLSKKWDIMRSYGLLHIRDEKYPSISLPDEKRTK